MNTSSKCLMKSVLRIRGPKLLIIEDKKAQRGQEKQRKKSVQNNNVVEQKKMIKSQEFFCDICWYVQSFSAFEKTVFLVHVRVFDIGSLVQLPCMLSIIAFNW